MQRYKQRIQQHFNRAAKTYHQFAVIQYQVAQQLLGYCEQQHNMILDVGAGSGLFSDLLLKRYPDVTLLDISASLLQQGSQFNKRIQADFEALPIQSNIIPAVTANMSLQWTTNLPRALREIHRVLQAQGYCYFSIPMEGTYMELQQVQQQMGTAHNYFLSKAAITKQLAALGFDILATETDSWQANFSSLRQLLRRIKAVGTGCVINPTARGLRGKGYFQQMEDLYQPYRNSQGQLPLSYHIGFFIVRK